MKTLYSLLLHLFPEAYREEFGEESQTVFNLSFDDARSKGILSVVRLALHEGMTLPVAIFHEHMRERRKAMLSKKIDSYLNFLPGSLSELLAAFAPFFCDLHSPLLHTLVGPIHS